MQTSQLEKRSLSLFVSLFSRFREASNTLWIAGLMILLLVGGWSFGSALPISKKSLVWLLFVLAGTVYPISVLLVSLKNSVVLPASTRAGQGLRIVLSLVFALYSIYFVLLHFRTPNVFFPVVLQLTIMLVLASRQRNQSILSILREEWFTASVLFVALTICWSIDAYLVWWRDWVDVVSRSLYSLIVFLGAMICSVCWVFGPSTVLTKRRWEIPVEAVVTLCAVILFGMASLRSLNSDGMGASFDLQSSIHHWGVYVGPVQMVRQGGYLLWDVPSQYGLLSILFPAILPFPSAWQAFYIALSTAQFCTAIFLFLFLRSNRFGLLNLIFPVILILAVVFIKPLFPTGIVGTQTWPSTTAYRFGGAYALIALAYSTAAPGLSRRPLHLSILLGTVIWLLGCFWSCESAVWCTVIWLPVLTHLLYRQWVLNTEMGLSYQVKSVTAVLYLLLPGAILFLTVELISFVYRIRIGHNPDWSCYAEYLRSARSGAFSYYSSFQVAATTFFLIPFIVLTGLTILASRIVAKNAASPAVTLLIAAFALLWGLNSYSISELHPSSMEEFGEVFCILAVASIIYVIRSLHLTGSWALLLKASFVPNLVFPILFSCYIFGFLGTWIKHTAVRPPSNIDQELPVVDSSLDSLLQLAGVSQSDPIVYLDDNAMPVWTRNNPDHRQGLAPLWIPISPCSLIGPVRPDRLEVYLDRYAERKRSGGWLIEPKHASAFDPAYSAMISPLIYKRFQATRHYENVNYRLTYFVFRPYGTLFQNTDRH